MMTENTKKFTVKLLLLSAASSAVWFFAVQPKRAERSELEQTLKYQKQEIKEGYQDIEKHTGIVEQSLQRVSILKEQLDTQLDIENRNDIHGHLQDIASQRGITIARIEPLRENVFSKKSSIDQQDMTITSTAYRVECSGSFNQLVRYLDDLSTSSQLAKVSSFRMVPISEQDARITLQVELFRLTDAPTQLLIDHSAPSESITEADSGDPRNEA